jgi:hypothetical protein
MPKFEKIVIAMDFPDPFFVKLRVTALIQANTISLSVA